MRPIIIKLNLNLRFQPMLIPSNRLTYVTLRKQGSDQSLRSTRYCNYTTNYIRGKYKPFNKIVQCNFSAVHACQRKGVNQTSYYLANSWFMSHVSPFNTEFEIEGENWVAFGFLMSWYSFQFSKYATQGCVIYYRLHNHVYLASKIRFQRRINTDIVALVLSWHRFH